MQQETVNWDHQNLVNTLTFGKTDTERVRQCVTDIGDAFGNSANPYPITCEVMICERPARNGEYMDIHVYCTELRRGRKAPTNGERYAFRFQIIRVCKTFGLHNVIITFPDYDK